MRGASVPRSSHPAALAAISGVAQQVFRDGFMRQPPSRAGVSGTPIEMPASTSKRKRARCSDVTSAVSRERSEAELVELVRGSIAMTPGSSRQGQRQPETPRSGRLSRSSRFSRRTGFESQSSSRRIVTSRLTPWTASIVAAAERLGPHRLRRTRPESLRGRSSDANPGVHAAAMTPARLRPDAARSDGLSPRWS
jgi:hypothetical protein